LLGRWLVEPLVARWWSHDHSPAALERDFGPSVDGTEPGEVFVAAAGGRPFGVIQRYVVDDYPGYRAQLGVVWPAPADAISIDYLIGEPHYRGRGLGVRMITTFVGLCWERYPQSSHVVVPIPAGNRRSWRALEGAGFARVAAGPLPPDNPRDPPDHFIYHLRRGASR
jgi:aminoglycoside 6'-N-acetyltransferase